MSTAQFAEFAEVCFDVGVAAPVSNDTAENRAFNRVYDMIEKVIPFNPEWNNGTGYFNGAARTVGLASGEYAKSHCPESDRKLIFVGTVLGTVVIFERYSRGGSGVFVHNSDGNVAGLGLYNFPAGRFTAQNLSWTLGLWGGTRSDGTPWRGQGGIAGHLETLQGMFAGSPREGA